MRDSSHIKGSRRFDRWADIVISTALSIMLFGMPFPHTAALKSISFFTAVAAWAAKSINQRKLLLKRTPMDLLILINLGAVVLSIIFSTDREYSLDVFQSEALWLIALYYLIVNNVNSRKSIVRMMSVLILCVTVISCYGVYGYLSQEGVSVDNLVGARATSIFPSFGRAAFYVTLTVPVIASLFLYTRNIRTLWLMFFPGISSVCFLILTFARGSWFSLTVVFIFLGFLKNKKILIFLLILALFSPVVMPEKVLNRALSAFDWQNFKGHIVIGDRYWLWAASIDMIKDYFWFGIGYGSENFQKIYPQYMRPLSSGKVLENVHNFYLQIIIERGIIGFIALIALFGRGIYQAVPAIRKKREGMDAGLLTGLTTGFAAFFTYGITTYRYENEISFLIWFYLAFIICLTQKKGSKLHEHSEKNGEFEKK